MKEYAEKIFCIHGIAHLEKLRRLKYKSYEEKIKNLLNKVK